MKSCYQHYEGCRLKGLPIGTPFKSRFFIPKSQRSKIQEDVDIFILLRMNSFLEGDNKNFDDQATATAGIDQSILSESENNLRQGIGNASGGSFCTSATEKKTGIFSFGLSPEKEQLKETVIKSEIQESENDNDQNSACTDIWQRKVTTQMFGVDILKDLKSLKVIDLCKGINKKCNRKERTSEAKKRLGDSEIESPSKKMKATDKDDYKPRSKIRLLQDGPPNHKAIEQRQEAFDEIASELEENRGSGKSLNTVNEPFCVDDVPESMLEIETDKTAANWADGNQKHINQIESNFGNNRRNKLVVSGHKKMTGKKNKVKNPAYLKPDILSDEETTDIQAEAEEANQVKRGNEFLSPLDAKCLSLMEKKARTKKEKLKNALNENDSEDFDPELTGLSIKDKTRVIRQRKKIEKESKRIKVKLEEHPDKYRKELMDSFARKDRGKARSESAIEIFVCTVCEKFKAKSIDAMEIHIESHVNGELHCTQCPYIAPFRNNLTQHKREVHKTNITICFECGVETTGTDGLRDHLGKVHEKPQYKCKFCLEEKNEHFAATTKNCYRIHIRKVHPEKLAACKTCTRLFANGTMLKRHMELGCAGDKPSYACEKCGKTYNSQDRVNDHVKRVHNKVRRFQCPHCPFTAARGAGLNQHLYIHSGYHPFKCDQCTFTCVQKYQLTSHMRTHTGDKPYKCGQCNYAAAWNVQLKDHVKVHGMMNTVLCDLCLVVFKDLRTFKAHQSKEHPMETHKAQQSSKNEQNQSRHVVIETQQGQHSNEAHQGRQTIEMNARQRMNMPRLLNM